MAMQNTEEGRLYYGNAETARLAFSIALGSFRYSLWTGNSKPGDHFFWCGFRRTPQCGINFKDRMFVLEARLMDHTGEHHGLSGALALWKLFRWFELISLFRFSLFAVLQKAFSAHVSASRISSAATRLRVTSRLWAVSLFRDKVPYPICSLRSTRAQRSSQFALLNVPLLEKRKNFHCIRISSLDLFGFLRTVGYGSCVARRKERKEN